MEVECEETPRGYRQLRTWMIECSSYIVSPSFSPSLPYNLLFPAFRQLLSQVFDLSSFLFSLISFSQTILYLTLLLPLSSHNAVFATYPTDFPMPNSPPSTSLPYWPLFLFKAPVTDEVRNIFTGYGQDSTILRWQSWRASTHTYTHSFDTFTRSIE